MGNIYQVQVGLLEGQKECFKIKKFEMYSFRIIPGKMC